MKCRECDDLKDQKGGHICGKTGAQIAQNRLNVDRPCAHHPEPKQKVDKPAGATPEATIEAAVTRLKQAKAENEHQRTMLQHEAAELDCADAIIQEVHAAWGFGPETAELVEAVWRITEKRLAALREAS